jgi:hypothetical protein
VNRPFFVGRKTGHDEQFGVDMAIPWRDADTPFADEGARA